MCGGMWKTFAKSPLAQECGFLIAITLNYALIVILEWTLTAIMIILIVKVNYMCVSSWIC